MIEELHGCYFVILLCGITFTKNIVETYELNDGVGFRIMSVVS